MKNKIFTIQQMITKYENAIDFAGKKLKVLPTEMDVVDYSPTEYELSSMGLYLIVDKKIWHYHLQGYVEKYFFVGRIIRQINHNNRINQMDR